MVLHKADGTVIPLYTRQNPLAPVPYAVVNVNNPGFSTDTVNVSQNASTSLMATTYITSDHIGSAQTQFAPGGWPLWQGHFTPYGQEMTMEPSTASPVNITTDNSHKFTGKERDAESGLDYFGARFYGSMMGRFMSPDPISGTLSNPQSLNMYAYVQNRPLNGTDPTGMIVEWDDSKKGKDGRTNAQRAFENRVAQLSDSKNAKDRANGAALQKTYDRLQASKATFEVVSGDSSGSSRGELTYQGNDHFKVSLSGSQDYNGFSDNQKLAHEFEHGRQVLDGELSFQQVGDKWLPFAHDLTDEANGFAAGFLIESAKPYQEPIINGAANALRSGGIPGEAQYLAGQIQSYQHLPMQLNVPNPPPPNVYAVPK